MERRRLQQQKMKQQQRFCISQQDLTQAIARMKPQRRATDDNLINISSMSTCSMDTLTTLSVSQLIKQFEARALSTPYVSAHEFPTINNENVNSRTESNTVQAISNETTKIKDNNDDDTNISSTLSLFNTDNDQTSIRKIDEDQIIDETEQIHQTSDNDRHKRDLPSSSSSSYYSMDSNNNNPNQMTTRFTKEAQFNHALVDLITLSNDADISSSVSSSSKSLTNGSQRQRTSSINENTNSISASIALLNNLLETFDISEDDAKSNIETKDLRNQNKFCYKTSDSRCGSCDQSFGPNEKMIHAIGQIWHMKCFVCAYCFQPFENGIYFEHENRHYCQRDFKLLFAPRCIQCQKPIIGRIIRAVHKCFHPDCFRCESCHINLVEIGFSNNNGRIFCRDCHINFKTYDSIQTENNCSTCPRMINNKYIKYKGEFYHADYFRCSSCRIELDENAREVHGFLYCLPCHNKLDLPVCAACRCLIDDRVVTALGKQWHVEHFCCARCAQPFRGNKHFECKGLAYCETDYHFLFGSSCFICNKIMTNGVYTTCKKKYCIDHFSCSLCERKMNEKSKFFEVDATPVCKQCFGKLPYDIRKSVEHYQKTKSLSSISKI